MYDGEEGEFSEWIDSVGEVTVQWTWCEGEDWECDGEFDVFVFQGKTDITYDIPKTELNWLEKQVPIYAGYEQPSHHRVSQAINAHFNKTF
jgi:hypothetical protein